MNRLTFIANADSRLTATVSGGRYLIVDYGREGFDALFVTTTGKETVLPSANGNRFHKASRHAMATCVLHYAGQAVPLVLGNGDAHSGETDRLSAVLPRKVD